jgi:NAD(P)-dependent dehydrogenase (short-subunit alcohol dehydrogenase family)
VASRSVIVTGAFGTLGRAVVRRLAAAGWRVAAVDVSPLPRGEPLPEEVFPVGGVDLGSLAAAEAGVARVVERFGRLDALVNVAGGFTWQTLADGDVDAWDRMYAVNLRTAVVATKAALPHLLAAGDARVVNVGAGAASAKAAAGMGAYTASKTGVQKLTESLSAELKDRGVNVNAVLPGTIDTPQNRADMPDADTTRWVAPEALADVILFLLSPAARAVTGAAIPVYGRG